MLTNDFFAQATFESYFKAGKASRFIRLFDLKPGDRVYLVLRVSNCERERNLIDQEVNLRRLVEAVGAIVVGVYRISISGRDPYWLGYAARQAQKLGATVLLAESTDRFIRNRYYHSSKHNRKNLQATEKQLEELAYWTRGMKLMTHLHPDASPSEVRSYQSKRGQREKRRKGGRPKNRTAGYKKRRQEEKIGLVLWLHRNNPQKWSVRRIAEKPMVNVPKSTVHEWIQKYG
jgi:hypothetical protein